jgi:hypothetical protein
LAVSTTYWPAFWPSPESVTLTLHTGASELELPVRPERPADAQLRAFGPVFVPENSGRTTLVAGTPDRKVYEWDVAREKLTIRSNVDSGRWRLDATGTEMAAVWSEVTEIFDHDPTTAKIAIRMSESYFRDQWDTRVESTLRLRLTRDHFLIAGAIKAYEHDKEIFAKNWRRKIGRHLV